ncbi:Serine/threonine-protein kinase CLA4 [Sphaceloma murrayae]|uniref:Serine/threonine-protein kinase CLA4 n=1 Tax=Sphaceloma murrayae TaxID=2082308 RepID=A0A2K1R2E8_9PEZI|nr:Serine/threonine-protein kinase CLA4 [Sphaceloma murrayae]
MSTDGLSTPGSSQYDSGTLYVGDGTWDANRNSFLLPNLVGFNLATTQYNGMGNRFRELPGYQSLVQAHGAIASVVFLLLVPTAITVARFYQSRRARAIRIHIWIQILVVFLLTVVLILGWFAVGPERSLTNPHHGIGVAIYTMVMVQVIGGAIVRRLEKYKDRDYLSVKVMLHHWFGRAIALLGLAQVPLGLALYGAGQAFYVVYALAVFAWILIYFILSHRYQSERFIGSEYGGGSYVSGRSGRSRRSRRTDTEVVEERTEKKKGHFLRNTALLGGALASWNALRNRNKRREVDETVVEETEVTPSRTGSRRGSRHGSRRRSRSRSHSRHSRHSRHTSGSYVEDEKYRENQGGTSTWRNRLLGAGAGFAAFKGVRGLFNKNARRDEESDIGSYSRPSEVYTRPSGTYSRPPISDNDSVSRTDISRVEAGQAPFSPADRRRTDRIGTTEYDSPLSSPTRPPRTPRRSRLRPRRSGSFSSVSSAESYDSPTATRPSGGVTKRQGLAATLAGLTGLAFLKRKNQERQARREEERAEELRRYDEEIADRVNRTQRRRPGFGETTTEQTVTEDLGLTGSNPALSRHNLPNTNAPPLPQTAAAPHSVTDTYSNITRPTTQPGYPVDSASIPIPTGPGPSSTAQFPESNTSRVRFTDTVAPATTSAAAALASSAISKSQRRQRASSLQRTDTYDTSTTTDAGEPPVSVKVKIHDDNRHVTLRRLNSAEAAAEREARRRERRARRRNRADSLSSGLDSDGGTPGGYRRRVRPSAAAPIKDVPPPPPIQRMSAERVTAVPTAVPGAQGPPRVSPGSGLPLPGPPPPPVPVHSSPVGGSYGPSPVQVNASMTGTGTGTEMSAFDDNRRRRRAERAAAKARALEGEGTPRAVGVGGGVRGDYT